MERSFAMICLKIETTSYFETKSNVNWITMDLVSISSNFAYKFEKYKRKSFIFCHNIAIDAIISKIGLMCFTNIES